VEVGADGKLPIFTILEGWVRKLILYARGMRSTYRGLYDESADE
jgi:hypothetical protein